MKLPYLSIFILFLLVPRVPPADPIDDVASLVREGNIFELSKLFADNIDVSIFGEENNYSKAQAKVVLDKFFSQNKPKTIKILHKVKSNPNYQFGVLIANTDTGTYRIAVTLKQSGGHFMLIEIRIETEKVK